MTVLLFYIFQTTHLHVILYLCPADQLRINLVFDQDSWSENIKCIVRTAPCHIEAGYRWPFQGTVAKFTSKDSKDKLTRDFEPILDERAIESLKSYTGNLEDLTIDNVVEGAKVSIKYSPVPYDGKKLMGNDEGFPPALFYYNIGND